MQTRLRFSLERVDGDCLGKLSIPFSHVAYWLNFLLSPHYGAQIISVEQGGGGVEVYFQACEGLYGYLENRIQAETLLHQATPSVMAMAH